MLAGCGGGSGATLASSTSSPLTAAQLRTKLLNLADLPYSWVQSRTAANAPAAAYDVCNEDIPVPTPTSAGFVPKRGKAPDVGEWLQSYRDHSLAESIVAAVRRSTIQCGSFGVRGHRIQVLALREGKFGDDSVAFQLVYTRGFIDVVVSAVGTTVLTLAIAGAKQPATVHRLTGTLAKRATAHLRPT